MYSTCQPMSVREKKELNYIHEDHQFISSETNDVGFNTFTDAGSEASGYTRQSHTKCCPGVILFLVPARLARICYGRVDLFIWLEFLCNCLVSSNACGHKQCRNGRISLLGLLSLFIGTTTGLVDIWKANAFCHGMTHGATKFLDAITFLLGDPPSELPVWLGSTFYQVLISGEGTLWHAVACRPLDTCRPVQFWGGNTWWTNTLRWARILTWSHRWRRLNSRWVVSNFYKLDSVNLFCTAFCKVHDHRFDSRSSCKRTLT